jgi:hypothetical protein
MLGSFLKTEVVQEVAQLLELEAYEQSGCESESTLLSEVKEEPYPPKGSAC